MARITQLNAIEILDSRGNPTIACECVLDNGQKASASVPSGASTGTLEAHELRDNDASRYRGKGVQNAVRHIRDIVAPACIGFDVTDQAAIDQQLITLDGTENLSYLGANATLAVSLAVMQAAAVSKQCETYAHLASAESYTMPVPFMNILNGGQHASNRVDIQEFMIVPTGFDSFQRAVQAGCEIYHALGRILLDKGYSTSVGDEGGFAPDLHCHDEAFEHIIMAVKKAGYTLGHDIMLALDIAASDYFNGSQYNLPFTGRFSPDKWVKQLVSMTKAYPIISIEDGMAENDAAGWQLLTQALGMQVQLVGDDVFVTQSDVLAQGINNQIANAILIKPNQVGTVSGTLSAIALAQAHNYNYMLSHRSGETDDVSIADLAVATSAGMIKTGAPCRGERLAKYNRLLL